MTGKNKQWGKSSLLSTFSKDYRGKKYFPVLEKIKLFPRIRSSISFLLNFYVIQVLVLLLIEFFYVCCTAGSSAFGSYAEGLYRFAIVWAFLFPTYFNFLLCLNVSLNLTYSFQSVLRTFFFFFFILNCLIWMFIGLYIYTFPTVWKEHTRVSNICLLCQH